jgi:hypothetical protein
VKANELLPSFRNTLHFFSQNWQIEGQVVANAPFPVEFIGTILAE